MKASAWQEQFLKSQGMWRDGMTRDEAYAQIGRFAEWEGGFSER